MIIETYFNPQENDEHGLSFVDYLNLYESTRATPISHGIIGREKITIIITSEYNMENVENWINKNFEHSLRILEKIPKLNQENER
jgi:hypothetical protein